MGGGRTFALLSRSKIDPADLLNWLVGAAEVEPCTLRWLVDRSEWENRFLWVEIGPFEIRFGENFFAFRDKAKGSSKSRVGGHAHL